MHERLKQLFSFPNPVNEVSTRLTAGGVVIMSALAIVLGQPWILAVIAYGFAARVVAGPSLSPLAQFVVRVVTPALPFEERPAPGPAKRFAQGIGALVTTTAAVASLGFGLTDVGWGLAGMIIVFALLEAALGVCVGCKLFAVLMRLHLVPVGICEECLDLARHHPQLAGSGE